LNAVNQKFVDSYGAIAFYIYMHRTTILLPDELYKSAGNEAKALGVSLGELIRRRLSKAGPNDQTRPAFFSRRAWRGEASEDLSANHDQHLYGS
jgi:hypothetical protein